MQVDHVSAALARLGWQVEAVPVTLDLAALSRRLKALDPAVVFNLVEALDGDGQFIHLAPAILDRLGLAYTGSSATAIHLTSHKILAKERLVARGLPTPAWLDDHGLGSEAGSIPGRYIVKSVWEDASIGLEPGSVVEGVAGARRRIAEMRARFGGAWFAEQYVDGREFNAALLAGDSGPELLPVAEIRFVDFPADRPRILDYASKWDEASFAYTHTPRSFDHAPADRPLVEALGDLARRCWDAFGLAGYARVDFRVDAGGRPFVLEINANPCLTPEAGFHAMLDRAGIGFDRAMERILAASLGECAARRRAV